MTPQKLALVVAQNVKRNRKNFVFSAVGITVGVSVFSFFVALTMGIREEVLNRIYPVDLIEVEPAAVSIAGTKSNVEKVGFNPEGVSVLEGIEGVGQAFPKLRSKFQATYRLGGQIFGKNGVTFEAYFDGLDSQLLRGELHKQGVRRSSESQMSRLKEKYGRQHRCYDQNDCAPSEECKNGTCNAIEYGSLFMDHDEYIACNDDQMCAHGYTCVHNQCHRLCDGDPGCYDGETCYSANCRTDAQCGVGRCQDGFCSVGVCASTCDGATCPAGQECMPNLCSADDDCPNQMCINGQCAMGGSCSFIKCVQNATENELLNSPELRAGEIPNLCQDGTVPGQDNPCPLAQCPVGTYCSVHTYFKPGNLWKDKRGDGRCERPIPVVLNPIVMELFNMVLKSTLEQTQLGSLDTLLGYEGSVTFGHSFYKETVKDRTPVEKRLTVVGFSNKALEAGVTMPMEYVNRANARYKGKASTQEFDSIILQLSAAEKLPAVMEKMDQFNIQLSRRSAEAEKFRTVLLVAIAIFFIMASIILGIAAINIAHTFLMVIYERKREIGILRAIGATKMDIRLLFLGESLLIGLAGATIGNTLAWLMSWVADYLANQYIGTFPFQPDTFFHFQWAWIASSYGFAVFFSIVGAFVPANRAAAMDPAQTLTLS